MDLKSELFLHAILIVKDHEKVLKKSVIKKAQHFILESFERQSCPVFSIGGTENHVHILFQLNPEISIDNLLKKVKLSSMSDLRRLYVKDFIWEEGYYVYSVSSCDIEDENHSIQSEPTKHKSMTLSKELKRLRDELQLDGLDSDLTDISELSFN